MAKTRKPSRKELKKDDEFVVKGQEIVTWASQYTRQLIAVGVGIVVVIVTVVAVSMISGSRASASAFAMGEALEIAERPVFDMGEDLDLGVDAFPTEGAKRAAFREALENVRSTHSGTSGAALAALYLGRIALDEERWDEAVAMFETHLAESGRGHKMRFAAFEGIGAAQEALGDLDAALDAYRRLVKDGTSFYRPFGMVHEARVLAALGRHEEARTAAQRVMDDYAGSPASRGARDLLGRLPPKAESADLAQASG